MLPRLLILLSFVFFVRTSGTAQIDKTYHQVLKLNEEEHVYLYLDDVYTLHSWAGTNVMMEAYIKYDIGNVDILNYFVRQGRYDLSVERSAGIAIFRTKSERFSPLQMKNGSCKEFVKIDIYVPEDYIIKNNNELERKKDTMLAGGK